MTFEEILPYLKNGWTCAYTSDASTYRCVNGKLFIDGTQADEFPAHLLFAEDWFRVIDINRSYKTASGASVRLYASDGLEDWPIHGAVRISNGWTSAIWDLEGVCCGRPEWGITLDPNPTNSENVHREFVE
jgi:hypothetical protein